MSHTKAGKAFTELILEIFQFNGRLLAAGDRLAKPLGLTSGTLASFGRDRSSNAISDPDCP